MKHSIEIVLDPYLEDSIDSALSELEDAIDNIRKFHPQEVSTSVDIDIHDVLAEHQAIAVVWDVQHVKDQRPDLSDEQAWEVLQECQRSHERLNDPMLETIRQVAENLFPKQKGKTSLRAYLARIERQIEALPEDEYSDPAAYGSVAAELDTVATIVKGA